jgi:hypothetical protein
MFNKAELEYLYMAVNVLPPPNTTQGGKAKAGMIIKLCELMEAPQDVQEPPLKAVGDKQ